MSGFITALTGENGITAATFFDPLTAMVPWLLIIIPAVLGIYFIRKAIKGAAKGKVRI